jgi:hypothetical protein
MLKSALLLTTGLIVGGAAIHTSESWIAHAAQSGVVYGVYEATVKDEAAYATALHEIEPVIKENGGTRIAGGFNKAKLIGGKPDVGNRARIIAAGYIDYLTGGPAEKGARVSIIECPDEAHARALFEAAKPVMESISCMSNPRISIVPGIPVAAAAAAE